MKVYLGPYRRLYRLKNWTNNLSDEVYESKPIQWFISAVNYLDDKFSGKTEYVKIDYYDIWSADSTLATIIHPLLVELKKDKTGYAIVADEDAPEELKEEQRWHYILDAMIFSFEKIGKEDDYLYDEEIQKGLTLFGKYYRTLWT